MRDPDVTSVMTTQVTTTTPATPFKELVQAMTDQRISAIPVVDERHRPIGVVSEADALAKQEFHSDSDGLPRHDRRARDRWYRAHAHTAGELMTSPVLTVAADQPVSVAARLLATDNVRRLFVLDADGRIAGVVSRRDLLVVYARSDDDLRADIEAILAAPPMGVPDRTVEVHVHDGVATVDGVLTSRRQAEVVARAVLATPGRGVRNNLRHVVDDVAGHGTKTTDFRL